jgi:hypothetical protein
MEVGEIPPPLGAKMYLCLSPRECRRLRRGRKLDPERIGGEATGMFAD